MYEEYKIYGPYTRSTGRQQVVLVSETFKTTMSYPKFLVETRLNIKLDKDITVHHIDGDFRNNAEENLLLLSRKEHTSLHAVGRSPIDIHANCVWCGKLFTISGKKRKHRREGKAGPFCSRKCSGEYGSAVQNGKIEPLAPNPARMAK